jgi:hypothetical protein
MSPITPGQPPTGDRRASRSTVNGNLTPNRRRRPVENDEYASFIRRVMRAYARRVAAGGRRCPGRHDRARHRPG